MSDAGEAEPLEITTREELAERMGEIFARLNRRPELARMMMVNPVMAMADAGVRLAPDVGTHVLHALQHPPEVQSRRRQLTKTLKKQLGEAPQPNDPKWLARVLFEQLKLEPLRTKGRKPPFRDPLAPAELERARANRPARMRRPDGVPRPLRGVRIRVAPWRGSYRRLDVDAPAPELKPADRAPEAVELTDLWFYKDRDPVARDLLELGVIERRAFPIQAPDEYRRIQEGEALTALAAWITSIRFNDKT
jgi:hypothetical protein